MGWQQFDRSSKLLQLLLWWCNHQLDCAGYPPFGNFGHNHWILISFKIRGTKSNTGRLYLPKMTYFCTKFYLEIILQPHSWCQKYSIQARWWNNVFGGNRRGWHSSLHHRIFFWVSHDIQVTCHSHQQIGVEWFLQ